MIHGYIDTVIVRHSRTVLAILDPNQACCKKGNRIRLVLMFNTRLFPSLLLILKNFCCQFGNECAGSIRVPVNSILYVLPPVLKQLAHLFIVNSAC